MKIKRFVGGSLESNCYIINSEPKGECYVIDPGYEPKRFINYIEKSELKIKGVLLTHHHHDHVGGAAKVADYFNCPVMMSFEDSLMYKGKVNIFLKDGDVLKLDGEELKVFLTPGHTHGSVCIMSEKSKVIFTGDTIFDTDLGRTDLSDGSPEEMIWTCKNVVNKWSNEFTIYPGHDESAAMTVVRTYNKEFLDCLEA